VLLLSGVLVSPALAQLSAGGRPASESLAFLPSAPTLSLPAIDADALLRADAARPRGGPLRFGVEQTLDLGLDDVGAWVVLPDGARLWRLRITTPGAVSLSLVFSRFRLPEGAELFVHDDAGLHVLGAYTAQNNKDSGRFACEPLPADALTLEYREPANAAFAGELRFERVVQGYRPLQGSLDAPAECYVGVKCPEAAGWELQVRAVVMVVIGSSVCSGSFLNTTAKNGQQLLMSADHCGSLDDAIFVFRYQNSECGGGTASVSKTVQGSKWLAGAASGDFQLVCVQERIPANYGVYYAGWDRSGITPAGTTGIHHPLGLPKSISHDLDAPVIENEYWHIGEWDVGVTEQGSSGSPLYGNGWFIGQLSGGTATCGNPVDDNYGRLDHYWAEVAEFLDPLDKGVTEISGYDPKEPGADAIVGHYDVTGKLVAKALGEKEVLPIVDEFTFFQNKTFTLMNGDGTWSRKQSGQEFVYTLDVRQSLQKFLKASLPAGTKVTVHSFEFKNGTFNSVKNRIAFTPDGDVTVKYQGKTIPVTFSGKIVAKRPCGCS
jgi:hypothetical protein